MISSPLAVLFVLATTEPTPPADPPAPDPGPSAGPTEDGGALFRLDRGPEPPPAAPGGAAAPRPRWALTGP